MKIDSDNHDAFTVRN